VIKSRIIGWAVHVASMGEMRNAYKIFAGKSKGKRPLGRPMRRWDDNITLNVIQTGWEIVG
jgi:hypothetical protein